jgi:hypothetical protein
MRLDSFRVSTGLGGTRRERSCPLQAIALDGQRQAVEEGEQFLQTTTLQLMAASAACAPRLVREDDGRAAMRDTLV